MKMNKLFSDCDISVYVFNKTLKTLHWNSSIENSSLLRTMRQMKLNIGWVVGVILSLLSSSSIAQTFRTDTVSKINALQLTRIDPSKVPLDTNKVEIDTISFDPSIDLSDQLPTIDSLYKIAYLYSPSLKFMDADYNRIKYNYEYTRKIWMNGISAYYNFAYGNLFSSTATNYTDGNAQSLSLTNGYKVGVNVQFPLTELFGRPKRLKSMTYEMKMSDMKKQEVFVELKRRIVSDYFNLCYNQSVLKVRLQDVESARITSDISEMEMKRGKVPPSEMSRYRNVLAIAENGLELARRDYLISYFQFEALMGIKLNTIRIKQPEVKPNKAIDKKK